MTQDFTAVDVETTGLNPKTDRLIEVAAVRVRNGQIRDCFESFLNPGRRLEPKITELTGITDEMLADAPLPEEVLKELLDFIGGDVLLGHSLMFDFSFIKRAAVNAGLVCAKRRKPDTAAAGRESERDRMGRYDWEQVYGIDTLKLARHFLPELESRSLPYLCRHFGIPQNAHRALEDARAAAMLYKRLAEDFGKEIIALENAGEAGIFAPCHLNYRVKREAPINKAQKERLYLLIRKHKLIIDYDVDRLTRNEASRVIDKIISEYGRL